uniref:C-type lectin domain family 10 member A-like n=1 Tax=Kryptolebias marmoratus TaxID=37003 RepID=A0A3Q3B2A4_KRYMA
MAEEEVHYSSVIFKAKEQSRPEATKEEETVYTEVRVRNKTPEETTAGLLPDKEAEGRHRYYRKLACCFGILCVILLFGVIGVCVYFVLIHQSDVDKLNHLKANQSALQAENLNLTNLNFNLSSDYNTVKKERDNLTMRLENLTQTLTVSESKIKNLTGDKQELTMKNQNLTMKNQNLTNKNEELTKQNEELETKTNNLTDQIKTMEETWNKDNISRSQWSIDNYCPKENEARKCEPCQKGWSPFQSSCYVYNNAEPSNQKTWEEARRDCRGKISDLTAVADKTEKSHVSSISFPGSGINGYWIGLKAVEGKWRLTDGSELTNNTWVNQPANENQCVISLKDQGWKAVSCGDRNAWICEKKALSV